LGAGAAVMGAAVVGAVVVGVAVVGVVLDCKVVVGAVVVGVVLDCVVVVGAVVIGVVLDCVVVVGAVVVGVVLDCVVVVGAVVVGLVLDCVVVVGHGLVFNWVKFEAPVKGLMGPALGGTTAWVCTGCCWVPQFAAAQLGENPRFSIGAAVVILLSPLEPQFVGKLSSPLLPFAAMFVGEGPKTEGGSGWVIWLVMGDEPKIDVPVDFPSLKTTVDLKTSSNSFKALYLSS